MYYQNLPKIGNKSKTLHVYISRAFSNILHTVHVLYVYIANAKTAEFHGGKGEGGNASEEGYPGVPTLCIEPCVIHVHVHVFTIVI